jgi:hypothetical protein
MKKLILLTIATGVFCFSCTIVEYNYYTEFIYLNTTSAPVKLVVQNSDENNFQDTAYVINPSSQVRLFRDMMSYPFDWVTDTAMLIFNNMDTVLFRHHAMYDAPPKDIFLLASYQLVVSQEKKHPHYYTYLYTITDYETYQKE